MISALQVLFTVVVVVIVYWGFKYRWRMGDMGKSVREAKRKRTTSEQKTGPPAAQDLVQCPKCNAYIPAGSTCSCEKA
jgi:hypothetical protein